MKEQLEVYIKSFNEKLINLDLYESTISELSKEKEENDNKINELNNLLNFKDEKIAELLKTNEILKNTKIKDKTENEILEEDINKLKNN